jgi:glycosyltransferase involved in cell wall biosynthesis
VTNSGAIAALTRRLRAVAPHLGGVPGADELAHGPLLAALADEVAARPSRPRIWLLATAVAGGYPTRPEMDAVERGLQLAIPGTALAAVLSGVARTASAQRIDDLDLEVVTGGVLVDVDFCAKSPHNTGIQRVVRSTMPYWAERPGVELVAWSEDLTGYRRLTAGQRRLVLAWTSGAHPDAEAPAPVLLVPWDSELVIPEVPAATLIPRQATLARDSGNRVVLVGHDAIPIGSADSMVDEESDRFAHYLEIVKHSHLVAANSASTAEEFRGFCDALPAQGLTGPRVAAVSLPGEFAASRELPAASVRERPLVLMVGSVEPRKNQRAVLSAAQTLWAEGLDFELLVIGGGHSWYLAEFDREVRRLARSGRHVGVGRALPDEAVAQAYRDAHVVVFPSLQEGFGLPAAEALATGTPVITTNYGSTAEIARDGGALVVNPRDEDDIAAAIASVLRDEKLHTRLVTEAEARQDATWQDYADALWAEATAR